MRSGLKTVWDFAKVNLDNFQSRNEETLRPEKVLEFHKEYNKSFKFQIPLEPRCLMQIVHPHFGYIQRLERGLKFDELI